MKKLLVLALVLGIAGFANAGLYLTANGLDLTEITLHPSDMLRVGIAAEAQTSQSNGILNLFTVQPGEWTGLREILQPIGAAAGWERYPDDGTAGVDTWVAWFADTVLTPMATGVIGEVEFHCKGKGIVILQLTDDSGAELDTLIVNQIPEPITMVLLGLGGLFLRRK